MSLALDAQTDIVTTQRIVSDIEIKKQQEQFGLLASADGSNILNVSIDNQGQNPIEVSSIWITNKTLPDQPVKRWDVNYNDAFVPSGFTLNALSTQPLEMIPDTYGIKVITTMGSIKTTELTVTNGPPPSSSDLSAELYMISPDVKMGQNATVVMHVTNIGDLSVTGITPDNDPPVSDNPTWISNSQLVSSGSIDLDPLDSGIFVWQTELSTTGTVDDKLMFSNSASGTDSDSQLVQSNIDSDKITLREIEGGSNPFGGPGEATGNVVMEFSSFQFCEPVAQDCTSGSTDWTTAWDVKTSTAYIWRINVANIGPEDILVAENTSLLMLHAQTAGGGNMPRVFFIKDPSTIGNEDPPGGFVNYSHVIQKDGTPVMIYFGVSSEGGTSLNASHTAEGINAAFLLIFGFQDIDESGTLTSGDIPYSQNLAYQGLRLSD